MRHLDLDDPGNGPPVIDELADALGGLDVLVNNAGGGNAGPFLEADVETFERTVRVNLTGSFTCAQRAAQRMVRDGTRGRIVNVTSIHEHQPLPGSSDYVSAKHGLGGLTKAMALDLASTASRSTRSHPGRSRRR